MDVASSQVTRVAKVVIPYCPRSAFVAYHEAPQRFCLTVAHRRAGKTVARVNKLIRAALLATGQDPRFGYLAPFWVQAKDLAWTYLKHYAAPLLALGGKVNESELSITLDHNGATVRLYGAENAERLRGLYFDGLVVDEAQDISPSVLTKILMPALSDRSGWLDLGGTPKSWHNLLGETYKRVKDDPEWYVQVLKASATGILPESELAILRTSMSEEAYAQEMECSFDASVVGAYFAKMLQAAKDEHRIGRVAADPLLSCRAFADLGGAGARSDAFVFWIAQFVGRESRILDYYEAQGQPLTAHVAWLRDRGYSPSRCAIWLPHDGATSDRVSAVSYESALRQAGYDVTVMPNQGRGAAAQRIESVRRHFGSFWIDEGRCHAGLDALWSYHERRDEVRGIGLGPEHDWSSHAADAFGLMAIVFGQPARPRPAPTQPRVRAPGGAVSWMA